MPARPLALMLAAALLAGCAAAATTETPQPTPAATAAGGPAAVAVPEGQALLNLYRPFHLASSANVYRFSVNGVEAADIGLDSVHVQAVPAGRVTVEGRTVPNLFNIGLALVMMERPTLSFDAEEGMAYYLQVSPGFAGGPQLGHVDPGTGAAAVAGLKRATAL